MDEALWPHHAQPRQAGDITGVDDTPGDLGSAMSPQPDASVDTGLLRNNTGWMLGLSRHAFFSSQVRRRTFQRNVWKLWGRIKRGETTKCIANRMHFTVKTCPDPLRTASHVSPDTCLHFSAHFSSLLSSVHPRSMPIHSVSPSGAEFTQQ